MIEYVPLRETWWASSGAVTIGVIIAVGLFIISGILLRSVKKTKAAGGEAVHKNRIARGFWIAGIALILALFSAGVANSVRITDDYAAQIKTVYPQIEKEVSVLMQSDLGLQKDWSKVSPQSVLGPGTTVTWADEEGVVQVSLVQARVVSPGVAELVTGAVPSQDLTPLEER